MSARTHICKLIISIKLNKQTTGLRSGTHQRTHLTIRTRTLPHRLRRRRLRPGGGRGKRHRSRSRRGGLERALERGRHRHSTTSELGTTAAGRSPRREHREGQRPRPGRSSDDAGASTTDLRVIYQE